MSATMLPNRTYLIRDAWDRQEWNNAIGKKKKNKSKKAKLEAKGRQLEELAKEEARKTAALQARMEREQRAKMAAGTIGGLNKTAVIAIAAGVATVVIGAAIVFRMRN